MKYKNSKAAKSIKTRDVNGLEQKNENNNIYVSINILVKSFVFQLTRTAFKYKLINFRDQIIFFLLKHHTCYYLQ